jgi:hypothetical protein
MFDSIFLKDYFLKRLEVNHSNKSQQKTLKYMCTTFRNYEGIVVA